MWIYAVVGPVAGLVACVVVYLIERGPIVGSRWIAFLRELRKFRDGD